MSTNTNTNTNTNVNINTVASLFPVGTTAQRSIKTALTSSTNAARTIAAYQTEHSLQNLMHRAIGSASASASNHHNHNDSNYHNNNNEAMNISSFEPQPVMTFLSHLTDFQVKHHSVHTQLVHRMRRSIEDQIHKLQLLSSSDSASGSTSASASVQHKHTQTLLGLLKSVWQVYLNVPEDKNVRAVLVAVLRKLGQKHTPKVLLQRLAQRRGATLKNQASIGNDNVIGNANDFSVWLKHGELFPLLGLPMQRAVFAADFELHAAAIFDQPIDMMSRSATESSTAASTTSMHEKNDMPILYDLVKEALKLYVMSDDSSHSYKTKDLASSDEMHSMIVRSANKSFVYSARERRVNTQQLRRSNNNIGLKKVQQIIGEDPVVLGQVLGLLVHHHGRSMKYKRDTDDVTNCILGGAEYLHCSLVSDILLSFTGQLPKAYVDLSILAKSLDQCVKDGDIADRSLAQIQSCLRPIFVTNKVEEVETTPMTLEGTVTAPAENNVRVPKGLTKAKISISKEDQEFGMKLMKRVLGAAVAAMRQSDPQQLFLNPVSDAIAPGYSRVISRPMCVLIIEKKIDDSKYATLDDFNQDVQTMFDNCITYNIGKEGTWFRTEARRQNKVFKGMILPQAQRLVMVPMKNHIYKLAKIVLSSSFFL